MEEPRGDEVLDPRIDGEMVIGDVYEIAVTTSKRGKLIHFSCRDGGHRENFDALEQGYKECLCLFKDIAYPDTPQNTRIKFKTRDLDDLFRISNIPGIIIIIYKHRNKQSGFLSLFGSEAHLYKLTSTSEYEPGMMKGGRRRKTKRTRRVRHRKTKSRRHRRRRI